LPKPIKDQSIALIGGGAIGKDTDGSKRVIIAMRQL
jgi:hypothetical protein